MNKEEALLLIQRMVTKEHIAIGESNSEKDSWKAYRESEGICDAALNPILIKLIQEQTLDNEELHALYHIFIFNCYNLHLGWKTIFDSVSNNTDEKIVQGILLQVANINITPSYRSWTIEDEKAVRLILEYTQLERSWDRSRAWRALAYVSVLQNEVEERVIEALESYDEEEHSEEIRFLEAEQLLEVISKIGTKKSLTVLKSTMEKYKGKQWISIAAASIGRIGEKEEEDYLIEQLSIQRNAWVKSVIAFQLTKFGSEKSIPAILDRAKKTISKKRDITGYFSEDHWFELIDLLQFLKKYENSAEIEKLFKWIVTKNLDKLAPKELEWVKKNI